MDRMRLPFGATKENLNVCENIIRSINGKHDVTESAIEILGLIYAKGGDFSNKTIQAYAEAYLKNSCKE